MDPATFVAALHEHLEKFRDTVADQLAADLDIPQAKAEKGGEDHVMLKAGDFVFLRRVSAALHGPTSVSRRFLPKADPRVYKCTKWSPHKLASCATRIPRTPILGSLSLWPWTG